MESLGHDLLLLVLHLSRMRDRERILQLFAEALASAQPGLRVRLLREGEGSDGEVVEIATPEASFGRLALEEQAPIVTEGDRARYRNAARMLAVVLENISRAERLASENARLDEAVAARTAELRGALETSEDLYQNAPCAYHSIDARGYYARVNDTELRWLGYRREEVVGKLRIADVVAPESQEGFQRGFAQVRERGFVENVELVLLRRDGSRLPVLASVTAVRDAAGAFVLSRSTMYDLSERRRAEELLRQTQERSRQAQKLEAIGRLAGGVAHDFNNLLTVILSSAGFLMEDLPPGDPRRQEALEIEQAGRRAARLTQQLLAFGRRQPTRPVPLDLGEIVAGMGKMLQRLIGEDVELTVARGEGLWPVLADAGQMEQVVLNLAVNARDAMPEGGTLRLETGNLPGCGAAGGWVRLCIADTGIGMSDEVRARIFEPFFTTKLEGKGTGLGLSTVYGIVQQAGGEIRVESRLGEGSRFEVLLPRLQEAPAAEPAPQAAGEVAGGSESILLVEDDPQVRAATAQVLRRAGYAVWEAGDGETALAMADAAPRLDLLVTDLVMPRLGGVPLAARLRARHRALGVVFLSGYPGEAILGEEMEAGAASFVQKPFSASTLERAVRERLDARGGAGSTPTSGL